MKSNTIPVGRRCLWCFQEQCRLNAEMPCLKDAAPAGLPAFSAPASHRGYGGAAPKPCPSTHRVRSGRSAAQRLRSAIGRVNAEARGRNMPHHACRDNGHARTHHKQPVPYHRYKPICTSSAHTTNAPCATSKTRKNPPSRRCKPNRIREEHPIRATGFRRLSKAADRKTAQAAAETTCRAERNAGTAALRPQQKPRTANHVLRF